jgi:hypothetical protein
MQDIPLKDLEHRALKNDASRKEPRQGEMLVEYTRLGSSTKILQIAVKMKNEQQLGL